MLLAFALPSLFVRRKPALLGLALWAFAFFGLFWFLTGQYLRYLLPAFALLCWPCGWMIARVLERSVWLKGVTLFALLGWFAFTPMLTWHNALQRRVVFGAESPEAFLRRTFAPYASMQWLNLKAPRANVAVYGEPRTFYLQMPYFWADDAHNNLVDYGRVRDGQALVAELRRLETTHVLWNTRGPFGPPVEAINDAIARNLLTPRFEVNGVAVFEISP
jgi:hypothetical protein